MVLGVIATLAELKTNLGLILSGDFLIGSLTESLLSESSVRTIQTSSDFPANYKQKKASPSI